MCCISAASKGVRIERKYLKNMWAENPHGIGFMVAKDDKLLVRKGFFNFKSFWKCFRNFQDYDKVVHVRWANRGVINVDNCHPFIVSKEIGMVHNGTISIPLQDNKSDTRVFNDTILKKLYSNNPNFLEDFSTKWFLSNSIGNSKLVFLNNKGEITIINKDRGEEFEGVWYSNADYKQWDRKKQKGVFSTPHKQTNIIQNYYQQKFVAI